MSSEDGSLQAARRNPEWWFNAYASEYLSDDAQIAEAREDFDAMIQQIEQRVLAQQPCYRAWVNADRSEQYWGDLLHVCPETCECDCNSCTARQTQETSG